MTTKGSGLDIFWLAQRCCSVRNDIRKPSRRELWSLQDSAPIEIIAAADVEQATQAIHRLFEMMDIGAPVWQGAPAQELLPMVALLPGSGCRIVYGRSPEGHWLLEGSLGRERLIDLPEKCIYAPVAGVAEVSNTAPSAFALFKAILLARRHAFAQAALASLIVNVLALSAALYSLQVYDRVIPTQGVSTLLVLTTGVLVVIVLELVIKMARSEILDSSIKSMDLELSHRIFHRLLGVRLDQFPASVGTLSSQLRSYETIRTFASTATLFAIVDAPFSLLFVVVAWALAGPVVAAIPVFFFIAALAIGLYNRKRIAQLAASGTTASNRKLGVLVETIENAESVKATGSGWQVLLRWNALNQQAINDEIRIRHFNESTTYLTAFIQQISYILLVAVGAWIASTTTTLTMGGIIACSILSGRMLAPVNMVPGLIVQWAHAKAALENLEKVFSLDTDNHGVVQPISFDVLHGQFDVAGLRFSYPGNPKGVVVGKLNIRAGEKVAILGSIGAGKSTLLKLLAGLYRPQSGNVLIDGIDIQQVSRDSLSEHIGYLPQDTRLFSGTLRDNLLAGLYGTSEQELLRVCHTTGLAQLVSGHPKGFDLEIAEGGSGVSGGQKQLVALTRLLLAHPKVWLLDEPTAAMDEQTESVALNALRQEIAPEQTLVLVTHKPLLLRLVDRIVVLTPEGIAMDGPRDAVLGALHQNSQQRIKVVKPIESGAVGSAK